jgi:hypothetical protein
VFAMEEAGGAERSPPLVAKVVLRDNKAVLDGNTEVAVMRHLRTVDPVGAYTPLLVDVRPVPPELATNVHVKDMFMSRKKRWVDANALAMIVMGRVGRPFPKYVKWRLKTVGTEAGLPQAVGAFASMARALAALHGHAIFHCDLNSGNLMVDDGGLGRFIDFGCSSFLQRLVLDDNYEDGYPMYINPFDGLVLAQVKNAVLVAADPDAPAIGLRLSPSNPAVTFDVPKMVTQYTTWHRDHETVQYYRRMKLEKRTVVTVHIPPCPSTTQDIFTQNCEYWVAALRANQWGPFDVYALGASFANSVNICFQPSKGIFTYNKLTEPTVRLLHAVGAVVRTMTNPVAAARPTAAAVWDALQALCADFGVDIPPTPPSVAVVPAPE